MLKFDIDARFESRLL